MQMPSRLEASGAWRASQLMGNPETDASSKWTTCIAMPQITAFQNLNITVVTICQSE